MIGNKRKKNFNPKKSNNKKKDKGIKIKTFESRQNSKKDEEILSSEESVIEDDNQNKKLKDDFFNEEDEKLDEITVDEKRLKMAKKLIQTIGEKTKTDGEKEEQEERDDINDYITKEITKEKKEHYFELIKDNFKIKEETFIKGHKASITSLALTADSKYALTTGKDSRAILWDINAGKKTLLTKFSNKPLNSCKLLLDDSLAIFGGNDKFLYLLDMKSFEIVSKVKAHANYINQIAFDTEAETVYSVSNDMTVKIWAGLANKHLIPLETFWGHTNKIYDIDFISKNRLVSCGFDKNIMLWKIDAQSYLQFKNNEDSSIDHIRVLNNNHFVSGDYSGNLFLWKIDKKKPIFKLYNSHQYSKQFNFSKKFEESYHYNYHVNNHNMLENVVEKNETLKDDLQCQLPRPILSIECVRNSDLIISGSNNGVLNVYKYNKKENLITPFVAQETRAGCVNDIKVNKNNEFVVVAHGKDGKFGRWDCSKKAKNGISVAKFYYD